MSTESSDQEIESSGWFGKLISFRGSLSQGAFFLGLIAECGVLLVGVMAGAALNNPTGAGGGIVILAVIFPLLALYFHFCLVVARMRDTGIAHPVIFGILVAVLPFLWLLFSLELVELFWPVVLIGFLAFYFGPMLPKSQAAGAAQS